MWALTAELDRRSVDHVAQPEPQLPSPGSKRGREGETTYVGTNHQVTSKTGQGGPGRSALSGATFDRAARLRARTDERLARSERAERPVHVGRIRERGEGSGTRARSWSRRETDSRWG